MLLSFIVLTETLPKDHIQFERVVIEVVSSLISGLRECQLNHSIALQTEKVGDREGEMRYANLYDHHVLVTRLSYGGTQSSFFGILRLSPMCLQA